MGKSTLFNRLTETKSAIVSAKAGTTRDRKEGVVLWRGQQFRLLDTGGLDHPHEDTLEHDVYRQADVAVQEADVILWVVDLLDGMLAQDKDIARQLSRKGKPVVVAGNKADKFNIATLDAGWYRLPTEVPRPVSAISGTGLGDLLDALFEKLKKTGKPAIDVSEKTRAPRIAFVGVPNVGKSSIVNEIIGSERFITSPIAHTTREANDTLVEFDGRPYILVDTVGSRRKARTGEHIEQAGVRQSIENIKRADVAVLVLDATKTIDAAEQRIARVIAESGVGCVIAANKWDAVKNKTPLAMKTFERNVYAHLPHLRFAPLLTISAKSRQRIANLFPLFDTIMKERAHKLSDEDLKQFLRDVVKRHKPSRGKGVAHPVILLATQSRTHPPTFDLTIKGRRADVLHPSYLRFLENRLREQFGFQGTSIHFNAIPGKR
ncbi:ribosome biogenesis GTPase Der [Candidatus Uhrbacteria bacterium]|nr:ribosome biogenesis GTPase Der [Candidatus Uhrbacteria bacterium]